MLRYSVPRGKRVKLTNWAGGTSRMPQRMSSVVGWLFADPYNTTNPRRTLMWLLFARRSKTPTRPPPNHTK